MRVVHVSDTHQRFPEIPKCDVLCHTGDYSFLSKNATLCSYKDELITFNQQLKKVKESCDLILFCPGNHDFIFEKHEELARELLDQAVVLIDEEYVYRGVKFYGTPSQPPFCDWAFNHSLNIRKAKYEAIPEDTEILLTHCPPYAILDRCFYGGNLAGCQILLERVKEIKPKYHLFGHIHEAYGKLDAYETTFLNSSIMDLNYSASNKPQEFDI